MRKSNLIDMSGLSGDPSEDARLDRLLFRLERDIPASQDVITAVFEPGMHRGIGKKRPRRSFYLKNSDLMIRWVRSTFKLL